MRFLSWVSMCSGCLVAAGAVAPGSAQTFAANTGVDPVIMSSTGTAAHEARVTVPGHRRHAEEVLLYGRVREGVYTVDGMVAKVQLNYDVNGARYLYLFVPGVGTAVVSAAADADAVVTPATYKGTDLSFTAGDHTFNLTGITLASDRGTAPEHLYVTLDRSAWHLNRRPMIGFGSASARPYQWPGALPPSAAAQAEELPAVPPVPASLLPSTSAVVPARSADPAPAPTAILP